MKQTIVIMALMGFTAIGANAQTEDFTRDSIICTTSKKLVRERVIPIQDVQPTTGKFIYTMPDTVVQTETFVPANTLTPATTWAPTGSCYRYTQNNLTVTKCPGTIYKSDNNNVYEYSTDGVYLGYFPLDKTITVQDNSTTTCARKKTALAPRHTVKKWTIPANAAYHKKECSPK